MQVLVTGGSHHKWVHATGVRVTLAYHNEHDVAYPYQVEQVEQAIDEAREREAQPRRMNRDNA